MENMNIFTINTEFINRNLESVEEKFILDRNVSDNKVDIHKISHEIDEDHECDSDYDSDSE